MENIWKKIKPKHNDMDKKEEKIPEKDKTKIISCGAWKILQLPKKSNKDLMTLYGWLSCDDNLCLAAKVFHSMKKEKFVIGDHDFFFRK